MMETLEFITNIISIIFYIAVIVYIARGWKNERKK